jgi:hypothetical protein
LFFGLGYDFFYSESNLGHCETKSCLATSLTWPSLTGTKCISIYLIFLFFFFVFVAVVVFFSSSLVFVRGVKSTIILPCLFQSSLSFENLTGPKCISSFSSSFIFSAQLPRHCLFFSSSFMFIGGCQINST